MDLFTLTRKLIDVPSLTGDEKAIGLFLHSFLENLGYRVELQEVASDRFNVFAGTGAAARVVFATHLDTVPPFIPASENDDRIFGRGACDAKGIIAAQIMAAEQLRAEGRQEVGLLFTVDEEEGSLGAQLANQNPSEPPPAYLINGEPTDNKLALATKGSLRLRLRTQGRAAHSAYPEQGESAIEKLLQVLESIRASVWPSDATLGETTCNIGTIAGGTRANVVAAEAVAELQLRLVTRSAPIKRMLERASAERAEIEYLSVHDPVYLHTVAGLEHCVVRFTTDIPYLSQWGRPLLLGPGSILNAHTDHEFVEKQQLGEAVELYTRLARTLLAEESRELETREGAAR
jgi:acetylornithine deacetylase